MSRPSESKQTDKHAQQSTVMSVQPVPRTVCVCIVLFQTWQQHRYFSDTADQALFQGIKDHSTPVEQNNQMRPIPIVGIKRTQSGC
jgi:hypothetical protein